MEPYEVNDSKVIVDKLPNSNEINSKGKEWRAIKYLFWQFLVVKFLKVWHRNLNLSIDEW